MSQFMTTRSASLPAVQWTGTMAEVAPLLSAGLACVGLTEEAGTGALIIQLDHPSVNADSEPVRVPVLHWIVLDRQFCPHVMAPELFHTLFEKAPLPAQLAS